MLMVKLRMAQSLVDAAKFVEQGRILISKPHINKLGVGTSSFWWCVCQSTNTKHSPVPRLLLIAKLWGQESLRMETIRTMLCILLVVNVCMDL